MRWSFRIATIAGTQVRVHVHFRADPHLVLVDALSDRRRAGGHGRV